MSRKPQPKTPNPPLTQQVKSNEQKPAQKAAVPTPPAFNPDKYIRPHIPRQEVIELKDKSGSIDPAELKQAFEELGYLSNQKMIYQILGELDQDNSGGIDFDEFFKLATTKVNIKDTRQEISRAFQLFDFNREGRITWDELKKVAQNLGEQVTDDEIKKMFKKVDLDEDGFVNFEDFYNIMTNQAYYK